MSQIGSSPQVSGWISKILETNSQRRWKLSLVQMNFLSGILQFSMAFAVSFREWSTQKSTGPGSFCENVTFLGWGNDPFEGFLVWPLINQKGYGLNHLEFGLLP